MFGTRQQTKLLTDEDMEREIEEKSLELYKRYETWRKKYIAARHLISKINHAMHVIPMAQKLHKTVTVASLPIKEAKKILKIPIEKFHPIQNEQLEGLTG